jgi:hypothetical protein
MYILVTHFDNHWDKLKGNKSKYTNSYIKEAPSRLVNNTESIFVRIDGANRIIGVWQGKVTNIIPGEIRTEFSVSDLILLSKEDWRKYEGFSPGWYVEDKTEESLSVFDDKNLTPPFFEKIESLNSKDFEQATHLMIRLLGIHRAYKFPSENQAGESDGFFRISNLCVIYDCTLREKKDFEQIKLKQIRNYCNRMHNAVLEIQSDIVEHLEGNQKQVWIITRKGKSHIFKTDAMKDTVIVKEISIFDLKDIYLRRLKINMSENELFNLLCNLGQ